jgi:uncharacterized protein YegL
MSKRKRTKGQTMIYKTLHRKSKINQHESHQKPGACHLFKWISSSIAKKMAKHVRKVVLIAVLKPSM